MKSMNSLNDKINNNVVKGYKGIMDLDLNLVPKILHEEMIKQHFKDIKIYDTYQNTLPEKLRYENTIARINQQLIKEKDILSKRIKLQNK
jgi:hypothetical protein